MSSRLAPRDGEVIDRDDARQFRWNGASHTGFGGDTIASALAAAGVDVFSRSFKYRRPRGILTADQHDPNLFLTVDGEPNVRAGHRLLESGMVVEAQNVLPSLRFDVRSGTRLVGRFLTPGFYYKTFMGPRMLRGTYQKVLRKFSAGGSIAGAPSAPHAEKRFAHPDVLVAGGGPAGIAAAIAASESGAKVMLVDAEHGLGGHLRFAGPGALDELRELLDALNRADSIEVLTDSVVTGLYDDNWAAVVSRSGREEHLIKVRAKALVAAPGKIERPYVFQGNDLPGVMLSTAALRLLNLWAVAPGTHAVVASSNSSGEAAASQLEAAGVEIAAIADLGRGELVRAKGRTRVAEVELAGGSTVPADLLVVAAGWTTATSLLNMAGDVPVYSEAAARFLPSAVPEGVFATGGIVGDGDTGELVAHGRAVGAAAAASAARIATEWARITPRASSPAAATAAPAVPSPPALEPEPHPETFVGPTDGFVDYSEDVLGKDLKLAVAEGYDSIELSKRYTTATMGPIQGKLEVVNAVAVHAATTGSTISATGTTTWRPPFVPVTLGALAGAGSDPVRRSPMHDWHAAHGAVPMLAGQWIRPDRYGDPAAEVRNTRESVGIIDVSPLGKIDLRGADVPRLLEFVYTNRWSRLGVGRARYGAMCGEDGVVFDDGVTARLGLDRYYMTTTSSGAGRVWNWLDEWLQTSFTGWDVRMTAVSDGYAAMNVAGPRSRRLLERVVDDVDLAADAFGYMQARMGTVAGISGCVLLRIGFTGELSFEVHVPAGFGLHVWEALLEAGADLGVAPFGIEAQRIMRLEKGHFIVGQDTDGLTKAGQAGLGWAVKTEKGDFSGRAELAWESGTGPRRLLVALQPDDPQLVPAEACQILAGDEIVGRVTSSRMSPTLGRSICLAVVAADRSATGTRLEIRLEDGRTVGARVMEHHAHFDPEGERLRG